MHSCHIILQNWFIKSFSLICLFPSLLGTKVKQLHSHFKQIKMQHKKLLAKFLSCGTQQAVPTWQNSIMLPARVANNSAGFGLSCPLQSCTVAIHVYNVMMCRLTFSDWIPERTLLSSCMWAPIPINNPIWTQRVLIYVPASQLTQNTPEKYWQYRLAVIPKPLTNTCTIFQIGQEAKVAY